MKKDNLLFIHRLLKTIGESIITIFIPLYILKTTNNINYSLYYLIIYSSAVLLLMFILKKFIQKYGINCMVIHFIPIIISQGLLSFCKLDFLLITIIAFLMASSQALYSIPLNLLFAVSDKKSNVGKFQIPTNIGKMIITLISGFILSSEIKNSFLILSIASSTFYILSAIPLIPGYQILKENYDKVKTISISNVKISPYYRIFHISFGLFQPIMDNIIPLYLYINNLSFSAVTVLLVLVELTKMIMNFLAQLLVNKKQQILCVILGSIVFISTLTSIIFIKNPLVLYILSVLCSVSFPLTFVPMFGNYSQTLRNTNNIIDGMTKRDFDIFSLRSVMYAAGLFPIGVLPILYIGIASIPVMLYTEIKILKGNKHD